MLIELHPLEDKEAFEYIKNYAIDYDYAYYMLSIFKDCDALDRVRIGDLDKKYLRIKQSFDLIQYSHQLYLSRV